MKSQAQKSHSGRQQDTTGFPIANSNGSYGSIQQSERKDEGVEAKPARDSTEPDEKKNRGMS